ncbi:hypothetical protein [Diaphorobacter sp. JS3051]|uniref:hypothetical protein n=1 Tax=Diaphorobacter sp. JS3051 TaxID=2792224 RepID=UPI001E3200A9|nr:hypothetical protein [Diaphorobacter sp. JS3051]
MCTYYEVPGREQLVLHFDDVPEEEWRDKMSPLYRGPFLRAKGEPGRELVVGQWGMIAAALQDTHPYRQGWQTPEHRQRPARRHG